MPSEGCEDGACCQGRFEDGQGKDRCLVWTCDYRSLRTDLEICEKERILAESSKQMDMARPKEGLCQGHV